MSPFTINLVSLFIYQFPLQSEVLDSEPTDIWSTITILSSALYATLSLLKHLLNTKIELPLSSATLTPHHLHSRGGLNFQESAFNDIHHKSSGIELVYPELTSQSSPFTPRFPENRMDMAKQQNVSIDPIFGDNAATILGDFEKEFSEMKSDEKIVDSNLKSDVYGSTFDRLFSANAHSTVKYARYLVKLFANFEKLIKN